MHYGIDKKKKKKMMSPENVVDGHNTMRSRRPAVVHYGGAGLHPHPAPVLGQQAVVLAGDLALAEHCHEKLY